MHRSHADWRQRAVVSMCALHTIWYKCAVFSMLIGVYVQLLCSMQIGVNAQLAFTHCMLTGLNVQLLACVVALMPESA